MGVYEEIGLKFNITVAKIKVEKRKFGKEVTIIEFQDKMEKDELKSLLKNLKKRLGCGGTIVDEKTIELQGNHKNKVKNILKEEYSIEVF